MKIKIALILFILLLSVVILYADKLVPKAYIQPDDITITEYGQIEFTLPLSGDAIMIIPIPLGTVPKIKKVENNYYKVIYE